MRKYIIKSNEKYNFIVSIDTKTAKVYFNISIIGEPLPEGGYENSDFICKIKGVQNEFITAKPLNIGKCAVKTKNTIEERLLFFYNGGIFVSCSISPNVSSLEFYKLNQKRMNITTLL